jgi:hypothetical protein
MTELLCNQKPTACRRCCLRTARVAVAVVVAGAAASFADRIDLRIVHNNDAFVYIVHGMLVYHCVYHGVHLEPCCVMRSR